MKRKLHIGTAAVAAATMVGTLISTAAPAMAAQNSNSTFSMVWNFDAHSLDPSLFSWEEYLDGAGIFEGLVLPGGKNVNTPRGGIATSWKANANHTVYTFTLRKNAKFSNGDPVTAQDFVFGMQRAVNPQTAVGSGASGAVLNSLPIKGAQQIRAGSAPVKDLGVKALNNYSLQITLSQSDPTFVRDLTLPSSAWVVPLDPKAVNGMSAQDWNNPAKIVSDGPYMVKAYTVKTSAVLVPNPHYYAKVPFSEIDLYATSSASNDTSLTSFRSGQLDESMLQPTDVAAAKNDPTLSKELNFYNASAQYTYAIAPSLNTALQNAKVREAFSLAIDRSAICSSVLQGAGSPAYSYFLPTWLDPWVSKYAISYNPTKAKQLMSQAGYPNGKGFPTVDIIVGSTTDNVAQAIQQEWEQTLGVNVKFMGLEYSQFVNQEKTQLPADQVGFINVSTNANYANLMLPSNLPQWLSSNAALFYGYLSPTEYQAFNAINNNAKLTATQKMNQEWPIWEKGLPQQIMSNLIAGSKAWSTSNQKTLQSYFGTQINDNFQIPIYTPKNPILLNSAVKGYQPDQFLLIDPPYWLGDISK